MADAVVRDPLAGLPVVEASNCGEPPWWWYDRARGAWDLEALAAMHRRCPEITEGVQRATEPGRANPLVLFVCRCPCHRGEIAPAPPVPPLGPRARTLIAQGRYPGLTRGVAA